MKKNLMVIFERYLNHDGIKLRIGGVVTRNVAHYQGVPHGAVQVAIVVPMLIDGKIVPHILLGWRSKWKKTFPETWDICGGHIDADEKILTDFDAWDDQGYIQKIFDETAVREANEELRLKNEPDKELFSPDNVKCYGNLGFFECGFNNPDAQNKEHSALYFAFISSSELTISVLDNPEEIFLHKDSIGIVGQEQEEISSQSQLMTLPELALDFSKNSSAYADGIARILTVANAQPGTMKGLSDFIKSHYQ